MTDKNKNQLPSKSYLHLKGKYKECVFLFRSGTYYLAYGNDAATVAELLSVPLTPINGCLNMAILPHCSLDESISILVKHGHKVALAEQIEPAETVGVNSAKQANLFEI
jgi:DNA mismatch repair protein MutS